MTKRFRQTKDCLLQFETKELDDFMEFLWNYKKLVRGFKEEYKNVYECEDTEGHIWVYPNCEPHNCADIALPRKHEFVECIYVEVYIDYENNEQLINKYQKAYLETTDGIYWYNNKGELIIDGCGSDIIWWRRN